MAFAFSLIQNKSYYLEHKKLIKIHQFNKLNFKISKFDQSNGCFLIKISRSITSLIGHERI